jgi:hypothetical protein
MITIAALLLLAASLSAPLAIPPMPEPVPLRADDKAKADFMNDAVEMAADYILMALDAMEKAHKHGCSIELTDQGFEDGKFSEFFKLVCTLIGGYFKSHGYDVSASTEGNTATIHVQLTELQS